MANAANSILLGISSSAAYALPIPPVTKMSATNQIAGSSTDTFTAIFNAASIEYQTVTGKRLDTHPLAAQLDTCHTPEAISNVFRAQAQAFSKFRKRDEKLMTWLDPIVHILFTFSTTLGEGIGLVSIPIHSVRLLMLHQYISHSHLLSQFSLASVFFSA